MEARTWPVLKKTLSESKGKRAVCEREGKGFLQRPADQSTTSAVL